MNPSRPGPGIRLVPLDQQERRLSQRPDGGHVGALAPRQLDGGGALAALLEEHGEIPIARPCPGRRCAQVAAPSYPVEQRRTDASQDPAAEPHQLRQRRMIPEHAAGDPGRPKGRRPLAGATKAPERRQIEGGETVRRIAAIDIQQVVAARAHQQASEAESRGRVKQPGVHGLPRTEDGAGARGRQAKSGAHDGLTVERLVEGPEELRHSECPRHFDLGRALVAHGSLKSQGHGMEWSCLPAPLFRGQRRHAHGVEASAERDAVAAHGETAAHRLLQQGIEAPDLLLARPGEPRRHRIPVTRHLEGPALETQHVGGRQPADILVERLVSLMRGDLVLEVFRDHGPMERGPDLPPRDDRVE